MHVCMHACMYVYMVICHSYVKLPERIRRLIFRVIIFHLFSNNHGPWILVIMTSTCQQLWSLTTGISFQSSMGISIPVDAESSVYGRVS